jgi:hypothetical protein
MIIMLELVGLPILECIYGCFRFFFFPRVKKQNRNNKSENFSFKEIALYIALAASAVGFISGCASKEKGYYELQREALNQDKKKECTMEDIIYGSFYETMRTAFNFGVMTL